jgi:hypothetical protein
MNQLSERRQNSRPLETTRSIRLRDKKKSNQAQEHKQEQIFLIANNFLFFMKYG